MPGGSNGIGEGVARHLAPRRQIVGETLHPSFHCVPADLGSLETEHAEADGYEGGVLEHLGCSGEIDVGHGLSVPLARTKGPATLGISDGG